VSQVNIYCNFIFHSDISYCVPLAITALHICMILGFHGEVDENCDLPGHYAASSSNFLPMFREDLLVPSPAFLDP
jgi:hypothetical protein